MVAGNWAMALLNFNAHAIRTLQGLFDLAQQFLSMANGGPGLPLAWTGIARLPVPRALAALLSAELPKPTLELNCLPTAKLCNALLVAFHCPA